MRVRVFLVSEFGTNLFSTKLFDVRYVHYGTLVHVISFYKIQLQNQLFMEV